MDWIAVASTIVSIVGLGVAFWQLAKTRRAAEAARTAANDAHEAVRRSLLLSELSASTASMVALKDLIRAGRDEAALLRVSDLMNQLLQLRHLPSERTPNFSAILGQLGILRGLLEKQVVAGGDHLERARVVGILSEISDVLHDWIGQEKYVMPRSVDHDT